jgi:hypothetical protein
MMEIKRGDLLPDMIVDLVDRDGVAVNLSTATAIRVIGVRYGVTIIDRATTLPGSAVGTVTIPLEAGDTALAGTILCEVEVMNPGAKPQTYPVDGYYRIEVIQDLG